MQVCIFVGTCIPSYVQWNAWARRRVRGRVGGATCINGISNTVSYMQKDNVGRLGYNSVRHIASYVPYAHMHTQCTLSYTYATHIIHFTVIQEELLQLVNPVVPLGEQTDL